MIYLFSNKSFKTIYCGFDAIILLFCNINIRETTSDQKSIFRKMTFCPINEKSTNPMCSE
jgi:hypothetical protein